MVVRLGRGRGRGKAAVEMEIVSNPSAVSNANDRRISPDAGLPMELFQRDNLLGKFTFHG